MEPEELTEAQKWEKFHAAMALEKEYFNIAVKRNRRREKTRGLMKYVAVLWLFFAAWGCLEVRGTIRDMTRFSDAIGK